MKIGVLCNSVLPLPAIQMLASNGLIVCIGLPAEENPETAEVVATLAAMQLSVTRLHKNGLEDSLLRWVNRNKPDVVFVMTFPWKIPSKILLQPKLGFFNFHYALLPKYRGASPVFWQLRNGESYGGLTVHKMDQGFDTGPIAHIHKIAIKAGETYGMHNKRLAWETVQGVGAFTQTLMLLGNAVPLTPQSSDEVQYFNRPTAKDLAIDWSAMSAKQIQCLVNACNPWNKGAFTRCGDIVFKIVQVSVKEQKVVYNQQLIPGTVINCSEKKTIDIITVDNNVLSIEVISVDEGIFTADFLVSIGLRNDMVLVNL